MKQIELPTSQNVILKYEVPELTARMAAFAIDFIILYFSAVILSMVSMWMFAANSDLAFLYSILVVSPLIMFYTLGSEILMKGQTLGKKALGIRRISLNGKTPEISDYVLAWSMRLIDIYASAGSLAIIFILGTDRNQRLGDRLSNTIVIKTLKSNQNVLNEILKIDSRTTEDVKYPQIVSLSEEQVLFMKNTLRRSQKYPNASNKQILKDLCIKVAKTLEIDQVPRNNAAFISQLVKDYVVLTR